MAASSVAKRNEKEKEEDLMPAPSRLLLKLSLLYLLTGFAMGAVMLANKAISMHPHVWQLLPMHIEMLVFGFIIQFTLGTAYWILPRLLEGPGRGGKIRPFLLVGCLNLGIILVIIDSFSPEWISFRLTGRVLELTAVGLFVSLHWNRIVSYRNRE